MIAETRGVAKDDSICDCSVFGTKWHKTESPIFPLSRGGKLALIAAASDG
jgi:hypothetical protein